MEEFADSKTALIADVDCTTEGKSLCERFEVKGYPSIKYGSPDDLQDYQGGRDLETLQTFAAENLGPSCSPGNLDLCDEEKKAIINKYLAMPKDELEAMVKTKTDALEKLESDFKAFVETLEAQIEEDEANKKVAIAAAADPKLPLMEAVKEQMNVCGPANLDKCDATAKAKMEKYSAMPVAELNTTVEEQNAEIEKIDAEFKSYMEKLQKEVKEKKADIDAKTAPLKKEVAEKKTVLDQKSACGPANLDMCDDEAKAATKKYMAMDAKELKNEMKAATGNTKELEKELSAKSEKLMDGLREQYGAADKKKDEDVKELENSGYKLMKSVLAFTQAGKKEEL